MAAVDAISARCAVAELGARATIVAVSVGGKVAGVGASLTRSLTREANDYKYPFQAEPAHVTSTQGNV